MLLYLDFESDVPIYMQIRNQIVIGIAGGELADGEKLPTIRALSNDLGINMMTVSKAYQLLKTEGYIVGDGRSGTVVKVPETGKNAKGKLSESAEKNLLLIVSEAKLDGIDSDEFLKICRNAYEDCEEA